VPRRSPPLTVVGDENLGHATSQRHAI
jgi:hypothetical protein